MLSVPEFYNKANSKIAKLTDSLLAAYDKRGLSGIYAEGAVENINILSEVIDAVHYDEAESSELVAYATAKFCLSDIPVSPFQYIAHRIILDERCCGGGSGGSTPVQPGSAFITEDISVTTDKVGGYSKGDLIEAQTDLTAFVKRLVQQTYFPTFTNPTFSLTTTPKIYKVGTIADIDLRFDFDRGKIKGSNVNGVWQPNTEQAPRAGAAVSYTFYGVDGGQNVSGLSNTYRVTGHKVASGYKTYSAQLVYEDGPQPRDSSGNDYEAPLAGGSKTEQVKIEGVYPIFATTSLIKVPSEQSLISMITGNNIELAMVGETGGSKQSFDIPKAWLVNRALSKVVFLNSFTGVWDDTNQLSTFATADTSHTINGVSIPYTRFTSIAPDRGPLTIKLIF